MNARLKEIFSNLDCCQTFADIGCDHGYMAEAMLKSGKCERAIIADVSAKCLEKAQELLKDYIDLGKVQSVVSDGFDSVGDCDLALIAGMGGEEIVSIIKKAINLPNKLVLQPMKNADKVRIQALNSGYKVIKDYVFYASKVYYDIIVLEKGQDNLTEEEIEFGRTNLVERGEAFVSQIKNKIEKYKQYATGKTVSEEIKKGMLLEIQKLSKYV
jgi:tRNA (adenine22-N1)-methyltransferase